MKESSLAEMETRCSCPSQPPMSFGAPKVAVQQHTLPPPGRQNANRCSGTSRETTACEFAARSTSVPFAAPRWGPGQHPTPAWRMARPLLLPRSSGTSVLNARSRFLPGKASTTTSSGTTRRRPSDCVQPARRQPPPQPWTTSSHLQRQMRKLQAARRRSGGTGPHYVAAQPKAAHRRRAASRTPPLPPTTPLQQTRPLGPR